MIRVLATGKLHDTPQARTSQNGNQFAICKVKADDKGGGWVWVSAIAFGQEAERLLSLKAGDAVAIGGRAELSVWEDKDGNYHPGLSLVADEVATLRGRPKPKPDTAPTRQSRQQTTPSHEAAPFDDELMF